MHGFAERSSGEQIDARCLELPRTGAKQREVESAAFNVSVHLVEEIGKALDFVDHHPATGWRGLEICGKERWVGEIVLVAYVIEQVDVRCARKLHSRPGSLPDASNAEQEKALSRNLGQSRIWKF